MLKRERIIQVLKEIHEFIFKNQKLKEEEYNKQLNKLLDSAKQEFNDPHISDYIFWSDNTDEESADIMLSIPQEKTLAEQIADRFMPANFFLKNKQDNEHLLRNLEVNGFRFSLKPQSFLNGNYVMISYPDGLSLGFVEVKPDKVETIRQYTKLSCLDDIYSDFTEVKPNKIETIKQYNSIEEAFAQTEVSLKLLTTNTPLVLLRLSYPYDRVESYRSRLYKLIISRRCLNNWKQMSFSQWDHRIWWHPKFVKHITNFQGTDEEFIPLLTKVLERINIILIEISNSEYSFPQTIPILPLT
jgi:hypothetical protein